METKTDLVYECRFNSQPPEGGWQLNGQIIQANLPVSTHSRPKAAGCAFTKRASSLAMFQLTAARRRLANVGWMV